MVQATMVIPRRTPLARGTPPRKWGTRRKKCRTCSGAQTVGDRICPRCGGTGEYEIPVLKPLRKPVRRSRKRIKARYRTKGGRHSDPGKLAWIRQQQCACYASDMMRCSGPVVPHHERRRGGRATDSRTVPLCAFGHHTEGATARHVLGPDAFAGFHGFSCEEMAIVYHRRYLAARTPEGRAP